MGCFVGLGAGGHAVTEKRKHVIDVVPASVKRDPFSIGIHPISALFPLMTEWELNALARNIRRLGLIHPIVVAKGVLVDGRNRLAACRMAGVLPRFVQWRPVAGESLLEWVLATNMYRVSMDHPARAGVAKRLKAYLREKARRESQTES